jgi:hypothetical protein
VRTWFGTMGKIAGTCKHCSHWISTNCGQCFEQCQRLLVSQRGLCHEFEHDHSQGTCHQKCLDSWTYQTFGCHIHIPLGCQQIFMLHCYPVAMDSNTRLRGATHNKTTFLTVTAERTSKIQNPYPIQKTSNFSKFNIWEIILRIDHIYWTWKRIINKMRHYSFVTKGNKHIIRQTENIHSGSFFIGPSVATISHFLCCSDRPWYNINPKVH